MEKFRFIDGNIKLYSKDGEGIIDDGSLSQKIAELISQNLFEYGIREVEIDFESSVKMDANS